MKGGLIDALVLQRVADEFHMYSSRVISNPVRNLNNYLRSGGQPNTFEIRHSHQGEEEPC
jgi:hypothetical protein